MSALEPGNREHIKLWIEALENDQIPQGKGALRRSQYPGGPDEFCCLGVACEVAIRNGVNLTVEPEDQNDGNKRWAYIWNPPQGGTLRNSDTLPKPVQEWLGIADDNPTLPNIRPIDLEDNDGYADDAYVEAASANDDRGWDFDTIAEALRIKYDIPRTV